MRRLFIIILFCITTLAFGQEMSVKSFYLAETDLTANTPGTMVRDQNGNLCALIKLETTLDGFSFDVGSLGISKTQRVGGEIWIYVPFGVRKITLSHPQLGVIRDYAIPCSIIKGRTYILKLDIVSANRFQDYSKKISLHIKVTPKDALVEIDGFELSANANGELSQTVPAGFHDLIVSAPRYHTERRAVNCSDSDTDISLSISLKPKFGWLKISDYDGESLYIDGRQTVYTRNK